MERLLVLSYEQRYSAVFLTVSLRHSFAIPLCFIPNCCVDATVDDRIPLQQPITPMWVCALLRRENMLPFVLTEGGETNSSSSTILSCSFNAEVETPERWLHCVNPLHNNLRPFQDAGVSMSVGCVLFTLSRDTAKYYTVR